MQHAQVLEPSRKACIILPYLLCFFPSESTLTAVSPPPSPFPFSQNYHLQASRDLHHNLTLDATANYNSPKFRSRNQSYMRAVSTLSQASCVSQVSFPWTPAIGSTAARGRQRLHPGSCDVKQLQSHTFICLDSLPE